MIRRIFLTRFLDSDDLIHAAGGGLKLVEFAPNVQHVQGGAANNLIVAMKDHLVVFDAPYGEKQSRWTIDAAKAKYPGKPVKYLVLTHHHMDHTGGMRSYVAEGATIVVPEGSKALFAKTATAKHTVTPDAQQKAGNKAAKIVEVKDTLALKDDSMEIRLLNIPNPHVDGMIIAHLPASNIVYVTDLLSPRGPDRPQSGDGRGRRRAAQGQHHRLHHRRRPRHHGEAGGDRPGARGELSGRSQNKDRGADEAPRFRFRDWASYQTGRPSLRRRILSTSRTRPAITSKAPTTVRPVDAAFTPTAVSRQPTMINKRPPSFFARRIGPSPACATIASLSFGSINRSNCRALELVHRQP